MSKRRRGRHTKRRIPEPTPDTPENVMRAILNTPPKRSGVAPPPTRKHQPLTQIATQCEGACVCAFASGRCGTHLLTQRPGSIDESIEAFREAAGYVLRLSVWEHAERSGELTAEAESYALSRNPAWTLADIEGPHRVETEVQEQRLFHD